MTLLHELFDASARRTPLGEAIRCRGQGYSYAELRRRSCVLANSLYAHGVRKGDRVAACMQNRPELVELALACSRLGAIFVPGNAMLKLRQLEHLIRDSGAKLLVCSQSATFAFGELFQVCPTLEMLVLCDTANAANAANAAVAAGGRSCRYDDLLTSDAAPFVVRAIADDPAALMYTSGSTGRSKGVIVSHRNLVIGALTVAEYQGNTAADRILVALPLSFDYGFNQVTTAFAVGACAVLTNFSLPAALLNEMAAERITGLAGVPTMWMHLAAVEWPAAVADQMRYITNSGGALPIAVIKSLQASLPGTLVFCMYGLTEAFRSTYLDPSQLDRRAGSIGKALPGQEVMVLRPDGSQCGPDEVGELVHRGSLVTLGYWNDPQTTAVRFKPWRSPLPQLPRDETVVWSGDLVRADSDGYLYFVGRSDDQIKSSGYRISATEIEEVVAEVPGVIESAAVGLTNEASGQRIVLSLVAEPQAHPDLAEIVRQHCRVHLPLYMVPAEVHVLPQLPRNLNGKCDRGALASLLSSLRTRDPAGNGQE